jgi:transposase
MDVLHTQCCGLDVHKQSIVACLLVPGTDGQPAKTIRSFGTTTDQILALVDWLQQAGCTHVAMESTGVYWKPVYNLLEGLFELLVVNAQHIKQVPGRKTDIKDAEWIATLLRHGLLRGSFIPPAPQRELRDLTRYRTTLVQDRARTVQRLQKVLEDANLKLDSVVSDLQGVSARAMLQALAEGTTDPTQLADLARGRLREKRPALEAALAGRVTAHHRFLLAEQLSQLDYLDEAIERVSAEVTERMRPFQEALTVLDSAAGVNQRIAEIIVAELGVDLTRFPSAKHLASWLGLCPGNHESAGKRRSGQTRQGNRWLRQALIEAAHGAARMKGSYLQAQYRRLAARRGRKRAIVAVAHSLVVSLYHMLTRKETYQDLGPTYLDERDRARVERRAVRRLEGLGYKVTLEPALQAA